MNFKIVLSDPKSKKAYQVEKEQRATGLVGKKIGENIPGDSIGLPGYEIQVTGGSDKQGFPMRRDVEGAVRKKILISNPPGFHPKTKGQRKRKSIRGNTVSPDIVQVNIKVVKEGTKKIEELLGVKAKPKEEKVKEEKKEEKVKEKPKEEKKEVSEKKEEKAKEEKKAEEKKEVKPKEEKPKESKPAEEKMGIKKLEDTG